MKFLSCINRIDDDDNDNDDDDDDINNKNNKKWYQQSIRLLIFKNKNKKKDRRVIISEPTPLSKEKIPEITGVVQIGPEELINDKSIINNDNDNDNDNDSNNNNEISSNNEKIEINEKTIEKTETETTELLLNQNKQQQQQQQNEKLQQKQRNDNDIYNYGWYWGNISRRDAENLLRGQMEGTFLVRKSSNERFLYSLSFRSNNKTLHTRIEYRNGLFSFYSNDTNNNNNNNNDDGCETLYELISDAMNENNGNDNIFFYSRGLHHQQQNQQTNETSLHTITLIRPFSRYQYLIDYNNNNDNDGDQYRSLQYLCKFVLHHSTIGIDLLKQQQQHHPEDRLPKKLKTFLFDDNHLFPYVVQNSAKSRK